MQIFALKHNDFVADLSDLNGIMSNNKKKNPDTLYYVYAPENLIAYVVDIAVVESTTFFMIKKCADVLNFFRKPVFSSKIYIFNYKSFCHDIEVVLINAHVESITKCMVILLKQSCIVLTMLH